MNSIRAGESAKRFSILGTWVKVISLKRLNQVNGKFLVRYELGLFGLPFSYTSLYKKSLSPFKNTHGKHPALDPELLLQQSTELRKSG